MTSLIIHSIGTADFSDCLALAERVKLDFRSIVKNIYQAPFVLDHSEAIEPLQNLRDYLVVQGFVAELSANNAVPRVELMDVAVRFDIRQDLAPVISTLSAFTGASAAEAFAMLLKPPCVVLGDVSQATVAALQSRLNHFGATVLASTKLTALYDLFLPPLDHITMRAIAASIPEASSSLHGDGQVVRGLSFMSADAAWRKFGHHAGVAIVNQNFLAWDVWLEAAPHSEDAAAQLSLVTDLPDHQCQRILKHLPVVIRSSVTESEGRETLANLESHGFSARAELTTFRNFDVILTEVDDPEKCTALLASFGAELAVERLKRSKFPIVLPETMSDIAARLLQKMLEKIGCHADLNVVEA